MPALLISNPAGRKANGQFKKGGRKRTTKKRRRRASTTKTVARRRTTRNPPKRRRRTKAAPRKVRLREMLPQAAAGVSGFIVTDWGTNKVIELMPGDLSSRIPAEAYPIVKGAVGMGAGVAISRYAPRGMRKYGTAIAIGGLISAGLDAIAIVRARGGMSGYWGPGQGDDGLDGYWGPGQEQLGESTTQYAYDPETGEYLSGPMVVSQAEDIMKAMGY